MRKLRGVSCALDAVKMHELVQQCLIKLKTISSIKSKVTKLSNEVTTDLDDLKIELESVLEQIDDGIEQAEAS